MFETHVRDGVCQFRAPDARWLSTAPDGGFSNADAAYNVTVRDEFDRTDLGSYGTERRKRADFEEPGPTLLTGVEMEHARGATHGPVTVVATVGLSNPATLPMNPEDVLPRPDDLGDPWRPGTVNLLVAVDRSLDDGGLATLLSTVVEAKTGTLLSITGFTGTTSDAAVVGCLPDRDPEAFAGSATAVGEAARACVREAIGASLDSRYADRPIPETVGQADHGVRTAVEADVFSP